LYPLISLFTFNLTFYLQALCLAKKYVYLQANNPTDSFTGISLYYNHLAQNNIIFL